MQAIELQKQLIEEIKQIPLEKIPEIYDLIHYFRLGFMQEKNISQNQTENSLKQGVKIGSLAGKGYCIPDNFNEPLDDLKDYM